MHETTDIAERSPGLQDPEARAIRSEQLIKALRMQVHLLEQRLAERERQSASLEMQIAKQGKALEQSTTTIERLTQDLERTMRECRTTIEALTPIVEWSREGNQLKTEALDHSWNARLETIRKALECL